MPVKKTKKRVPVEEDEVISKRDDFIDEPEEHSESEDNFKANLRKGKREGDVYTKEGREDLVENDELEPWEEGYIEGTKGNEGLLCKTCKKPILDFPIERQCNHDICWFCSDRCADVYEKKNIKKPVVKKGKK